MDLNSFTLEPNRKFLGYISDRLAEGADLQVDERGAALVGGGRQVRFHTGGVRTANGIPEYCCHEALCDLIFPGGYNANNSVGCTPTMCQPRYRARIPVPQVLAAWFISDPGSDFRLFQDSLAREFEYNNVERGIRSALHQTTATYRDVGPNYEPYRRLLLCSTHHVLCQLMGQSMCESYLPTTLPFLWPRVVTLSRWWFVSRVTSSLFAIVVSYGCLWIWRMAMQTVDAMLGSIRLRLFRRTHVRWRISRNYSLGCISSIHLCGQHWEWQLSKTMPNMVRCLQFHLQQVMRECFPWQILEVDVVYSWESLRKSFVGWSIWTSNIWSFRCSNGCTSKWPISSSWSTTCTATWCTFWCRKWFSCGTSICYDTPWSCIAMSQVQHEIECQPCVVFPIANQSESAGDLCCSIARQGGFELCVWLVEIQQYYTWCYEWRRWLGKRDSGGCICICWAWTS